MSNSIGENIKYYRKLKGMNQKELSNKLGVSTSYLQKLELGQKDNPSLEIKIKLSNVLDIPLDELSDNIDIDDFDQIKDMLFKQKENSQKIGLKETMLKLDISNRINEIKSTGQWTDADTMIILNELAWWLKNKSTSMEVLKNYISLKDYDISKLNEDQLKEIDKKFSDILELEFYKLNK